MPHISSTPQTSRHPSILIPFLLILFAVIALYTYYKLRFLPPSFHHHLNHLQTLFMFIFTLHTLNAIRHQRIAYHRLTTFFALCSLLWATLYMPLYMLLIGLPIALISILVQSYQNHQFPFRSTTIIPLSQQNLITPPQPQNNPITPIDHIIILFPLLLILFQWIIRFTTH